MAELSTVHDFSFRYAGISVLLNPIRIKASHTVSYSIEC
jgi:hypothetical protein